MPTQLGIEMQKLQEEKRHHQAGMDEHIGTQLGSNLGGAAIGALGRVGSALIKKNDISWYNIYLELLNSSAKLNWPYKKGYPMLDDTMIMPSVLALDWVPTIGTTYNVRENAPIMKAFKVLFNTVRGKNSGATNYDAVDLGIVCLSIDTIQVMIEEAKRALRIVTKTKELDPMTVRQFGTVLGYDSDSIITNKQDWINAINKAISDLNSLMIPGGLSYFERHKYLANMMLAERKTDESEYYRSLYYVFRIKGVFSYDELNGELDYIPNDASAFTYSSWYSKVSGLLSKLINSSTVAVMTGDIEGAVNRGAIPVSLLHHMDPISEADIDDTWPVIHDEQTLMQIRNATVFGSGVTSDATQFSIHQAVSTDGNPFVYQGTMIGQVPQGIRVNSDICGKSFTLTDKDFYRIQEFKFIYSRNDFPDEEEVMESTRLMAASYHDIMPVASVTTSTEDRVDEHGSEIISGIKVYFYGSKDGMLGDTISRLDMGPVFVNTTASNFRLHVNVITAFKYAPKIKGYYNYSGTNILTWSNYQEYNMTTIFVNNGAGNSDLAPLHECALRSELAYTFKPTSSKTDDSVPDDGKQSKFKPFNKNNKNGKGKFNKGKKPSKKDKKDKKDTTKK